MVHPNKVTHNITNNTNSRINRDSVNITNSIIVIQPVTNYRKKVFSTDISKKLAVSFSVLELTSK